MTPVFAKTLERLGPFSIGNEVPIFRLKECQLKSFKVLKGSHVKWTFSSKKNSNILLQGISFGYIDKPGTLTPDFLFEQQNIKENELVIYCSVGINRWKGREYIQLNVSEVTLSPFD